MKIINLIYGVLVIAGFSERLARYICAQAAHETGDFKSKIFRLNNNLFGMKVPKIRKTTALYESNGHAVYENPESSVQDFIIYWKAQNYPMDFNSPDLFVEAIHKRGYFEADIREYKKGVNFFYNKYFNETEPGTSNS